MTTENTERTAAVEVAVLGHMKPILNRRKLSDISGVRRTTVRKILKQHKVHPNENSYMTMISIGV